MIEALKNLRQHLLTGVSYAIPFIACGGIMIAAGIAFVPMGVDGPEFSNAPIPKLINDIGSAAFKLLLPVLAGYIAYAIAGRPGLVPGFIGGYLSGDIHAGFLGAIFIGLIAGWIVNQIKLIPVPKYIKPIMPILIIPIVSSTIVGVLMLKVLGMPIASLMSGLGEWLKGMQTGNAVVLAMVLGAMIAFDMGGPVNKAAFFFGSALIEQEQYSVMGACAAAICTPPLGMGLASLLRRQLWKEEEREAGIAALTMGMIGITEGAIPFAAADPVRVIPCIMLGSMVASTIAMLGGVGDHAPHGGPIVLPVVDHRLMYIVAIIAGTLVTALAITFLKSLKKSTAIEDHP
ncbi:MAG: PTS system mannose-specific EIIBCA component [Phycisphaerae bacterium]|nr:PTS system mannose-specific EIIBCA component [Phycisphaerae bacterium]